MEQIIQLQSKIEEQNVQVQVLQREMQQLVDGRTKMVEQQNENELVIRELELLEPEAKIYKLIGSVLVGQNLRESKENVDKRILFIKREIAKVDTLIKENQTKQGQKRQISQKFQEELYRIYQSYQQAQQNQQTQK